MKGSSINGVFIRVSCHKYSAKPNLSSLFHTIPKRRKTSGANHHKNNKPEWTVGLSTSTNIKIWVKQKHFQINLRKRIQQSRYRLEILNHSWFKALLARCLDPINIMDCASCIWWWCVWICSKDFTLSVYHTIYCTVHKEDFTQSFETTLCKVSTKVKHFFKSKQFQNLISW